MTTLDNRDDLLARAYDLEQAGDLIGAAALRAQAREQQQQAAPVPESGVWSNLMRAASAIYEQGRRDAERAMLQEITNAVLDDQTAPRLASVQDDHGETFSSLVAGEGLTEVRIAQDDEQPGVLLTIGGSCINQELGEIITLDDVRQLRDNLSMLLSDPRLGGGPVPPSVRPVPSICDDTADPRHGTQIGVDWVSGPGVPESAPYVYIPDRLDDPPIHLYLSEIDGIPLATIERYLPHIIALLTDPRVQAARAAYEERQRRQFRRAA